MKWELTTIVDLEIVVKAVLEKLEKNLELEQATVLALHGDLGAGKTTFMQTLARHLKVTETVTSPTFVVMKIYDLYDQSWDKLIHIDAYRIEEVDEMRPLGFDELLKRKGTIIGIEWAEKIESLLPKNTVHLNFSVAGNHHQITLLE